MAVARRHTTDPKLAGSPLSWPVRRFPNGTAEIQLPDGRWYRRTQTQLAELLADLAAEDPISERKLEIARRLAGEERFAEFLIVHAQLAAAYGPASSGTLRA